MNSYDLKVAFEPFTGSDSIDELSALISAAKERDNHNPLGEHVWLDLHNSSEDIHRGFKVKIKGHSHLVGYLHICKNRRNWTLEYVVHPNHRHSDGKLESLIVKKAIEEIRAEGGGHVHMWVFKPTHSSDKAALENGLSKGRLLYQMIADLNDPLLEVPEIDLVPFEVGKDEEAWLKLNNAAFGNHPEQGAWDIKTLQSRFRQPWFDPKRFYLYKEGEKLIGFCWIKIHEEFNEPLPEIYVIAVDPEYKGNRIGQSMLAKVLKVLKQDGFHEIMLYVDSTNEPALRLYEKFNFKIDHIDMAYVGDIG